MNLIDCILLTFVNAVICLVFPKLISSAFGVKSKSAVLPEASVALKEAN